MDNQQFLKTLPNSGKQYFDVAAAVDSIEAGAFAKMPYSLRVFAENLVRKAPKDELQVCLQQLIGQKTERDFPWFPARVVCHDILGQTALVDLAGLRDAIAAEGGDPSKVNPVVPTQLIVDHSLAVEHGGDEADAFDKNRAIEERRNKDRFDFINWCKTAFDNVDVIPPGNGILHQINLEKMSPVVQLQNDIAFADTLVGTDSHTPMVDALGVISIGVGGLEAESVMLGRASYMRVPEIIGVEVVGKAKPGITATDIVLQLTEYLRNQKVVGSYIEFFGEGVANLTLGDRATISNMTPEYGATAAMFSIDSNTLDYLALTGRAPEQIKLVEEYAKANGLWSDTLTQVNYQRTLKFDLSIVERNLAGPSTPHNRLPVKDLVKRGIAKEQAEIGDGMPDGAVIIAAITSCTNTSNPRNMIAAGLFARHAVAKGLIKKDWVKTSLAPGSKAVEHYLKQANLLEPLEKLGFGIVAFACTSCNGMSGAIKPEIKQEIEAKDLYTTAVLSGNRNFDGRIHPHASQAFLASPPLVIAYALAGSIRIDIESQPLGLDKDGKPVYLKELWPADAEIDAIIKSSVLPEHFNKVYQPMFDIKVDYGNSDSNLYNWREMSTYIRRPPYWQGALANRPALKGMRPLAILGDNITTDHLSPSNAIQAHSAAGEYLAKMGLPEEDFNSYATHRGDHLTAQRATFANPKLINEMVRDEFGDMVQGSLTMIQPEAIKARMWEAIETYMQRKQPLIVVAGKDYGQGSSRDWAAKGVRLAGVEVVLAEGFERIHRTNLIGMGVLPLEFINDDRLSLGLNGTETYSVEGEVSPGAILQVNITRADGTTVTIDAKCRVDTFEEADTYCAGGVLQRFAKEFLANNTDNLEVTDG
ncbi:Fe/S-dependent 2-methylisocitrate dehydratase AcnD [Paraferrimonas sp. SM1919]|uniref:Fe/S-dependent 2-methylisocitrate dehydratase AcnD n=1 Tax=Paraferrimonas sp. SM1919 TaxID=2662263 RepID=UPI0013D1E8EB|nr:Fe/S-dependent 2-methylisocitrate dehydratase AcnD [Paraferrimonas sp. SM1919]